MMRKISRGPKFRLAIGLGILAAIAGCRGRDERPGPASRHDLAFADLASTWDEGLPLGNGLVGALVWRKGNAVRLSLDRSDLWDLRPMSGLDRPEFRFSWVREQVLKKDYRPVQELGDVPYERDPAPTKIPAGALEFDAAALGEVASVRLALREAVGEVVWKNGARLKTFVHATEPVGWFDFKGLPEGAAPRLVPPAYGPAPAIAGKTPDSVAGQSLAALNYAAPRVTTEPSVIRYRQEGWGGMFYDIVVEWRRSDDGRLTGVWAIGASYPARRSVGPSAVEAVRAAWSRSFAGDLESHRYWWRRFWARSAVALPDPLLEKQWYLETYKFGAASRRGAPPITLQAVWTADNGSLPPWKGDFHHDLNTQLSYWPCYSGNRLEDGLAYLDWLWEIKPAAEAYTRTFFGTSGLNVPGVSTLEGKAMGGWVQYSLSPTVSAWLAQHFYWHWIFSRDEEFLRERAYPWLKAVAVHLDELATRGPDGRRRLPLSSSPEINDNRLEAWFLETTNYDLALIRWLYGAAAELADKVDLPEEAAKWRASLAEWPDLARDGEDGRLLIAPNEPLRESHRHFSHLMAIHPLGLVDWENGDEDRRSIRASLADLDRLGTDWWCGYSFSWLGNLAARARDGDRAARALRLFAECFCLPNSFHANGDQCRAGHSKFTYRPFTLEGNFAFAAAIQEMLLQGHTGTVRVFPAVPADWRDAAFETLRAPGAFLVSARLSAGRVAEVRVAAEKGGRLRLADPFGETGFSVSGVKAERVSGRDGVLEIDLGPGETVTFTARQ
jgi:alpha-L-fucosidase 2